MTDKDKEIHSMPHKKNTDEDLWEDMMKDVLPLEKKNDAHINEKNPRNYCIKNEYKPPIIDTYIPIDKEPKSKEVDERTYTKFKRGQMPIEGRIDLHGMTQNQAYDALLSFIPRMYAEGRRCVLVITGKGNRQDSSASLANQSIGVLKKKTPIWLNETPLEQYVLKTHNARPNHGGDGALYVLLRRNRS